LTSISSALGADNVTFEFTPQNHPAVRVDLAKGLNDPG
jgi:hypothetical protein